MKKNMKSSSSLIDSYNQQYGGKPAGASPKKTKKPFYKKWCFWVIVVLMAGSLVGGGGNDDSDQTVNKSVGKVEEPTSKLSPTEQFATDSEITPKGSEQSRLDGYIVITVDGGDISGKREANVAVDVGFGDREYWAFTNEYGQLVRVIAKEIVLQNDSTEPVTSDGRYYNGEASIPGTELDNYDQGHIIADSLGGVSNAYNITPQESTMNRYGNQAYMEKSIREAGGCTDFEAIITYPATNTQIPSHYHYTYTLMGNVITEDFDNINPDAANKELIESQKAEDAAPMAPAPAPTPSESHGISTIDRNGNGQVTISEAKAAGFKMPITEDHWLYQYMDDRDSDGMVGE